MAHIRQSSLGFQAKVLETVEVVPQVQDGTRIWVDDAPPVESQRHPGMAGVCLMQVYLKRF